MRVVRAAAGCQERRLGEALLARIFVDEMRDDTVAPAGFETDPLLRPTTAPFTSIDPASYLFCALDDQNVTLGALAVDRLDLVPPTANDLAAFQLERFFECGEPATVAVIRWLGVDKAHRGGPTLMTLLGHALRSGLDEGVEFVLLDCSPYLVEFYERFGARRFAPHIVYPYTGILTVPMVVPLSDIEHHRAMGSALTDMLAAARPHRADVHDWLIAEFGPYGRLTATPTDAVGPVRAPGRCGLFAVLPEGAYDQFVARAPVMHLKRGEAALCRGEVGRRDLRIVLHGYLEVLASRSGGPPTPVATLGPGEPIGEISMLLGVPATADVIALTDATIAELDLDGDVESTVDGDADTNSITDAERALLWRAVATTLAERVRRTTLWVESPPLR